MLPLSLQRVLAYRPSVVGTGSSAQRVLMGPCKVGTRSCRHWVLGSWSALGPRHKGSCRHWLGPSKVGTGSSAHGKVLSALGLSIQGRHWVLGSRNGPVGTKSSARRS